LTRFGFGEDSILHLIGPIIGIATGFASVGFFELIEWFTSFLYGGVHQLGVYGGRIWLLPVLPAVGGLLVGLVVHRFAQEAKGHGVPEVMDAMARREGVIRPRVALAKAVSSVLTIGTGGSAGTEGPIVQVGAAIGSTIGQVLGSPRRHMRVLIGCGTAAGISSIFNAPIAGVLFALEVFLRDLSLRSFAPVVFASVLGSTVANAALGRAPEDAIFSMPNVSHEFAWWELGNYLVLGLVCGFVAVAFIRILYWSEDAFERLPAHPVVKPVIGGVAIGILAVAWVKITSSEAAPEFFGNSYALIMRALDVEVAEWTLGFVLALWLLKIASTSLTLGSGGSGGVFAPSLFLGCTAGGAFGLVLLKMGLISPDRVPAYSLVGMAAVVAGTTHAPLTSILIVFEITQDYRVILPVMLSGVTATLMAQLVFRDSIYTLKLRRRGVRLNTLADTTILKRLQVSQIELQHCPTVLPDDPLQSLLDKAATWSISDFAVVDDKGDYQGMAVAHDIKTALLQREAIPLLVVGEIMRDDLPTVGPYESLDLVLDKFARHDVQSLAVSESADNDQIRALITRQAVMRHYHIELERQTG
jgi:CIC family chloride channel protein